MEISYSIMSDDYLDSLLNVINTCFSPEITRTALEHEYYKPISNYIIAIDESTDKVIGFIGIWIVAGEGDIINVGVLPEYRNMGIGSKLINSLTTICRDLNCRKIFLEVRESNKAAKSLYNKFSFIEESLRKNYYSNPVENAITMSLEI